MAKKWLIIIFCLALFLRVYKINANPLYGDELTIAYDSYSILKTGHDSTGKFLPITFEMGAGRPAGYVYASVPFVAIFGPTALGVRSLSIISGVLMVLLMYILGKKLFSEKVGVIAAFFTAFSPWEISLSRAGFEAHFALFLAVLGIIFFIYSKDNKRLFIPWALLWGLAIHTYPTFKLALPLFFIVMVWYLGGYKKLFNKHFLSAAIILLIFSILSLNETFFGISEQRFFNINIFSSKSVEAGLVQKINLERTVSGLSNKSKIIFHNKPFEYVSKLKASYLNNFSTQYFFINGDGNPRHNPSEMGSLYIVELPLIIFGFLFLWKNKNKLYKFLLLWIAITPLATSLLGEQHYLRNSFMLPPLIMLSAVGIYSLKEINRKNRTIFLLLAFCFWFIQFIFFFERLYFVAPNKHASFWSYPAKKASEVVLENKKYYDYIIISNKIDNIDFAYLVYGRVDPEIVISNNNTELILEKDYKKYDNVFIGNYSNQDMEKIFDYLKGKTLFVKEFEDFNISQEYGYMIIDSPDLSHSLVSKSYGN